MKCYLKTWRRRHGELCVPLILSQKEVCLWQSLSRKRQEEVHLVKSSVFNHAQHASKRTVSDKLEAIFLLFMYSSMLVCM